MPCYRCGLNGKVWGGNSKLIYLRAPTQSVYFHVYKVLCYVFYHWDSVNFSLLAEIFHIRCICALFAVFFSWQCFPLIHSLVAFFRDKVKKKKKTLHLFWVLRVSPMSWIGTSPFSMMVLARWRGRAGGQAGSSLSVAVTRWTSFVKSAKLKSFYSVTARGNYTVPEAESTAWGGGEKKFPHIWHTQIHTHTHKDIGLGWNCVRKTKVAALQFEGACCWVS